MAAGGEKLREVEILSGTNYYPWSRRIKATLSQKRWWEAIEPGYPDQDDPEEEEWTQMMRQRNEDALNYIIQRVDDLNLYNVNQQCITTKGVWAKLKEIHIKLDVIQFEDILEELISTDKVDSLPMRGYIGKMTKLVNEVKSVISNMNNNMQALAAAFLIRGLKANIRYEHLVQSFRDSKELNADQVRSKNKLTRRKKQKHYVHQPTNPNSKGRTSTETTTLKIIEGMAKKMRVESVKREDLFTKEKESRKKEKKVKAKKAEYDENDSSEEEKEEDVKVKSRKAKSEVNIRVACATTEKSVKSAVATKGAKKRDPRSWNQDHGGSIYVEGAPGLRAAPTPTAPATTATEGLPNACQVKGIKIEDCRLCAQGKAKKKPFPAKTSVKTERETKEVLQIVHSDVCSMKQAAPDGSKYFITFHDDYSRFSEVKILKKSESFESCKKYMAKGERFHDRKLRCLQLDNGGEYISKEFEEYLEENGVERRLSCPYNPQQNGKAERLNQTLLQTARCMMIHAWLPNMFWPAAKKTPFEIWHERRVETEDLKRVKVLGCEVWIRDNDAEKTKLNPRATRGLYMCVQSGRKGVKAWDLQERKVKVALHIDFCEEKFPMKPAIFPPRPPAGKDGITANILALEGESKSQEEEKEKGGGDLKGTHGEEEESEEEHHNTEDEESEEEP
ncbi:hypothetical protein FOCC_FOCC014188 [Frankliniella occidentalis]|nr:hypothetical protein FOCC_FOCC014188 [Frankliniella occidentalis]